MRLGARVARATRAVAATAAAAAGCPGRGVVNRLAAGDGPDPPPCPACGGCNVLVIDEVVIAAGDPLEEPPGP